MALDPKKFALLTSAIAASIVVVGATTGGCTETAVDDADSGSGSSGEATSSSSSGGSSSGGETDGGGSSSGDGGGSSSGDIDAGSDASACLGEGAAPSCDAPTGCLAEEGNETVCSDVSSVVKPGVAASIIACLNSRPTCEDGNGGIDTCREDAVAEACPDATAAAFCDTLLTTACADSEDSAASLAGCNALVPALTEAGKTGLGSCVEEYGV